MAISVIIVLTATAAVLLFDLHPAVMIFGMIFGSSLGLLRARHMAEKRVATSHAKIDHQ